LSDWLRERPFSLAMSSGFFSFFAHAGLLSVLIEEGFVPVRVSGSSAGALVTAAWAGGVEPGELSAELSQLERKHFWDPAFGPGFLRGALFQQRLDKMLAGKTFETARVPAAVSVFELKTRRTKVMTKGAISTAIRASCAVPGLFHPVEIDGRLYWRRPRSPGPRRNAARRARALSSHPLPIPLADRRRGDGNSSSRKPGHPGDGRPAALGALSLEPREAGL
jgi:NTE family protein